jgi:hypothetical protein
LKTRIIVSALTVAALSLGSVSSFAQGSGYDGGQQRYEQHRDHGQRYAQRGNTQGTWQRGSDRGQYVQRVPAPAPAPDWRVRNEWREHQHRGYVQNRGYYQQPGYVYAQPGYYEQPGYYYQQPQYYGYDNSGDAGDIVLGAIVGGVIANAIVNSR